MIEIIFLIIFLSVVFYMYKYCEDDYIHEHTYYINMNTNEKVYVIDYKDSFVVFINKNGDKYTMNDDEFYMNFVEEQ